MMDDELAELHGQKPALPNMGVLAMTEYGALLSTTPNAGVKLYVDKIPNSHGGSHFEARIVLMTLQIYEVGSTPQEALDKLYPKVLAFTRKVRDLDTFFKAVEGQLNDKA